MRYDMRINKKPCFFSSFFLPLEVLVAAGGNLWAGVLQLQVCCGSLRMKGGKFLGDIQYDPQIYNIQAHSTTTKKISMAVPYAFGHQMQNKTEIGL